MELQTLISDATKDIEELAQCYQYKYKNSLRAIAEIDNTFSTKVNHFYTEKKKEKAENHLLSSPTLKRHSLPNYTLLPYFHEMQTTTATLNFSKAEADCSEFSVKQNEIFDKTDINIKGFQNFINEEFFADNKIDKNNVCRDEFKNDDNEEFDYEFKKESIAKLELLKSNIKEKDINLAIETFNIAFQNALEDSENSNLNTSIISRDEFIKEIEEKEKEFQNKLKFVEDCLNNKDKELNSLHISIRELMNELEKGEEHRRKLHNYIQELRGNIRVYCRVKPLNEAVFIFLISSQKVA